MPVINTKMIPQNVLLFKLFVVEFIFWFMLIRFLLLFFYFSFTHIYLYGVEESNIHIGVKCMKEGINPLPAHPYGDV